MLERLSVSNLAIVAAADIEFIGGLNIITGETGAGKSVIMGALELVLGARAEASAVRDGAKEARISAQFRLGGEEGNYSARAVGEVLAQTGLPPCEDNLLIVRRVISASGSRVWVNDAATTVQTLRTLSRLLVDVHGPNDHQSLLDETFQRQLVDLYAHADTSDYAAAWKAYHDARSELSSLTGDTADFTAECEALRYAVDEIDDAQLSEADETDLPARHAAAAHAAEILEGATAASDALTADDGPSAASALNVAVNRLAEISRYHEPAAEWCRELEDLAVRVQELSRAVAESATRLDADGDELQALDERLTLVKRLERKYAPTVAGILELRERKAARLKELESRDERIAELTALVDKTYAEVVKAAAKLSAARRRAQVRLGEAVTHELQGLGFLRAGFAVELSARAPDATGADKIDFLFEPNPGEKARSLREIASTGEIARVMLALKTVVSRHDVIPVLVFDEIDSNIGGEVGRAVGERLLAVSKHRQVIAITHLAQSAVYGRRHFAVAKTVVGERTQSTIRILDGEARVSEIARMLGGAKLTSVVTQHARELLSLAE